MKEVTPGLENDEKVVIEDGLAPGDKILTYSPEQENDVPLWAER